MAVIWLGGAEIEEKVGIERWCLVGAKGNPRWEKDSGGGGGFDGWDISLDFRVTQYR